MRVVVLTEYSKSIGFGHVSRSMALADVFAENNYEVVFLIRAWTVEELNLPYAHFKTEWKDAGVLERYLQKDDICIFDTYQVKKGELNQLASKIAYPVSISDSKLNFPDKGLVIIGSVYGKQLVSAVPENMDKLIGPGYIFFRKAYWDIAPVALRPMIKKVVISLGGFTGDAILDMVVDCVSGVLVPEEIVVMGRLAHREPRHQVVYKGFLEPADYINELMNADLMISNGGQSLNESILMGIPTVALSVAQNQDKNMLHWADMGVIESCGGISDPLFEDQLRQALRKLAAFSVRSAMAAAGRKHLDSKGSRRVFDKIVEYETNICKV